MAFVAHYERRDGQRGVSYYAGVTVFGFNTRNFQARRSRGNEVLHRD